jgi:hypothetical protein
MCWTHCWPLECVFVPPRHASSVHKHTLTVHPGAHTRNPHGCRMQWLGTHTLGTCHCNRNLPLLLLLLTPAARMLTSAARMVAGTVFQTTCASLCLHQLLVCPPRLTTSIAASCCLSVLISAASGAAATPLQLQLLVMQPTSMNSWSSALERMALAGILAEVARRRGPPPVIPTARPVTRGARSVSPDLEPPAPMAPCCCFYCCPHPCCCSCWLGMLAGYCCPTAAGAARDGVVPAGTEAYSTANTACHQGSRCSYDVT